MDRNCYTYLIGWSQHNTFYYGRRTRKGCDPSDLWKIYYTSSVHVHRFVSQHGDPDIVQIRKVFGNDHRRCEDWESKVLVRIDAKNDTRFLNKRNNVGSMTYGTTGVAPAYTINGEYLSLIDTNDPRWGIEIFGVNRFNGAREKLWQMTKERLDNGTHIFLQKNNPSKLRVDAGTHHFLPGHSIRQQIDDLQRELVATGRHHWLSEEHRESTSSRTRAAIASGDHPCAEKVTCPHCKKTGQKTAMYRWHFNNCAAK